MIKRFHRGISTIAKCFDVDLSPLTKVWLAIYLKRKKFRGKADAVKFMKELNTVCERYALRQPIDTIPWTKADDDGFPCILSKFKTYLRSEDTRKVVFALSVMRSCELLKLPISKDISTVVDPCQGSSTDLINKIINFNKSVCKLFKLTMPRLKYHLTIKNGPNGPALQTSDSDISAILSEPKLLEAIRVVEEHLDDVTPMSTIGIPIGYNSIHSKLVQFPDKAGKTRTIAIIDYYSQRCLYPLHKGITNILSRLVSDGTYSHRAVGKFAQEHTGYKSYMYCADLTAATDRFPKRIQEEILHELVKDRDLSNALWTLLSKRTFRVAWADQIDNSKHEDTEVTYNCGQPMGAYASWPLFALAHHLIVWFSAKLAGKSKPMGLYRLIGDDVIICDEETATIYRKVMTKLGLTINKGKTVESPIHSENSGAEVAKQLYLNGKCLTPLTPGFVRDIVKPYMFNSCIGEIMSRYEFCHSEIPARLIDALFMSEKNKQLAWVVASDPISGNIKPSFEGYDIKSPWRFFNKNYVLDCYNKVALEHISKTAMELLIAFQQSLEPSGPPSNGTSIPQATQYVCKDIQLRLLKISGGLISKPPEEILEEFDYIPDPSIPFRDRMKTKYKRLSTWKELTLIQVKDSGAMAKDPDQ